MESRFDQVEKLHIIQHWKTNQGYEYNHPNPPNERHMPYYAIGMSMKNTVFQI